MREYVDVFKIPNAVFQSSTTVTVLFKENLWSCACDGNGDDERGFGVKVNVCFWVSEGTAYLVSLSRWIIQI